MKQKLNTRIAHTSHGLTEPTYDGKAKPFRVRVTWSELDPLEYAFATKAELEAFCYGIDQYDIERGDGYHNDPVYISRQNADGTWSNDNE